MPRPSQNDPLGAASPRPLPAAGSKVGSIDKPLVLVTGSTGLIGSRLLNRQASEFFVVGMDVKPPDDEQAGTTWIECDLTDTSSVNEALVQIRNRFGHRIASVIHLAAYYDFSGEPSPLYEELTVEGTRRLLNALKTFQVEQFVFSSSLLVMEPAEEGELITEQSPTEATWDYPESKLAAEAVIREHHGAIPALVLRIAGVYDEEGHSVPLAQQISRIYEKKLESYFFPGDADHGQAFIHLDDLVAALVHAVEHRHAINDFQVLLIAEPDVMSYEELQDRIGELLHGREWPTIRIPKVAAKAGAWVRGKMAGDDEAAFIKPWMIDMADMHYPVAIDRARQCLGWSPKHRLRDTIDEMTRRLKADPVAWYRENNLSTDNLPQHDE